MPKIIKISWERANIIIEFNKIAPDRNIYLISNEKDKIELKSKDNRIKINTTNTPEGEMLKPNKWYLEIDGNIITINKELIKILDGLTRVFKYSNDFYAYIVNFSINEDYELIINTDFMMKNNKYEKKYLLYQGKNIKEKIIILIKIICIKLINIIYKLFSIINISKNNILFLNENDDVINGNLKIIYENLKKEKLQIQIYSKNVYEKDFKKINYIKELYAISKAKHIIVDNYTSLLTYINLSSKTKIIQTWHAGVGFKAVGYARFGKKGGPHPYLSSHRKYNHIIVDNDDLIDIYNEVFGNKKENFIPCGIPRLNKYLEKEEINIVTKELFERYPELKDKKIILFAPTYRGVGHKEAYYDINKIDLNKINKFCKKNNFIFIIKMHSFITKSLVKSREFDNILELSNEDINKLIYISDILITDYSSCVYEFSLFNRPVIFYRFDKDIYEYQRPMHTKDKFTKDQYEVYNFEQLLDKLNNLKNTDIKKRFSNIKRNESKSVKEITKILSGD